MLFVRFAHYLGMAMWIGGWMAIVLMGLHSSDDNAPPRSAIAISISRLHTLLIAPGAVLTIGSGIMWSMAVVGAGGYQSRVAPVGLSIMTAVGMLGGVLVLAVCLPAARRLRALSGVGLDAGPQMVPVLQQLSKRLMIAGNVAGICALASLFASVLAP